MQRLWKLRRMKALHLDPDFIFDVYIKEVRPILELAAPVWHSSLTKAQSQAIERVQKVALSIILGEPHTNYELACSIFCAEPLDSRRDGLCLQFAKKTSSKSRHTDLFLPSPHTVNTRQNIKQFSEHRCHNKRFYNSPLPYLTRLLNSVTN